MIVDSEEKAKIAVLASIGTALICEGRPVIGIACFALMLPWGILARVAGWLAHPVVNWRKKRGQEAKAAA